MRTEVTVAEVSFNELKPTGFDEARDVPRVWWGQGTKILVSSVTRSAPNTQKLSSRVPAQGVGSGQGQPVRQVARTCRCPASIRDQRNAELVRIIKKNHEESRRSYGSSRAHAELTLGRGEQVNRKRVERTMREAGIQGIYQRRGHRNVINEPTEEDLVKRAFDDVGEIRSRL